MRRALHALTIVRTGSGHSSTLIQCSVQYRARSLMADILIQNGRSASSNQATSAGRIHFGRGGCGCLGGTMIRGTDLARVGSSSLEGSGNLFSLKSQAAR